MSFGGAIIGDGLTLAKSSQMLFCFLCTAISVLFAFLSLKFKNARYAVPIFSVIAAVYTLVIRCSDPGFYIDFRPLSNLADFSFTMYVLLEAIVLFALLAVSVAYLFTADYVEVMESGKRLPLIKRIMKFFKDYRGEIKKIVWPGPRAVVKNTIIVFIMCALVGAFIWLIDWGLGSLVNLILGA